MMGEVPSGLTERTNISILVFEYPEEFFKRTRERDYCFYSRLNFCKFCTIEMKENCSNILHILSANISVILL